MLGWVAVGPEISASPIKGKEGPQDAKVVLGNKQMMADEGIPITKAVDEYMRDMEVRHAYCSSVTIQERREGKRQKWKAATVFH